MPHRYEEKHKQRDSISMVPLFFFFFFLVMLQGILSDVQSFPLGTGDSEVR